MFYLNNSQGASHKLEHKGCLQNHALAFSELKVYQSPEIQVPLYVTNE